MRLKVGFIGLGKLGLPCALDLSLEIGGVEANQQVALTDLRAFRRKERDLGFASAERRAVRDGIRRAERPGGRQTDDEIASAGDDRAGRVRRRAARPAHGHHRHKSAGNSERERQTT